MYIKRVQSNGRTYYYLARKHLSHDQVEERLAALGSLETPTFELELALLDTWLAGLLAGAEERKKSEQEKAQRIADRRRKTFNLKKCLEELSCIRVKYGYLTKQLLEETARPNGELSWGVQTLLKNFRRHGLSFKKVFDRVDSALALDLERSRPTQRPA